jgi:uncharacterized membrane protein YfcA
MTPALAEFAQLAPLGFVVGLYGTLIGAGGGFVLVPALLLLTDDPPAAVTSTALAVVFFNAYTGTIAYARMRRIDYFAGVLFALAGAPGAVLGTVLAHRIDRASFEPLFGVTLLAAGAWLALRHHGVVPPTRAAGAATNADESPTRFNSFAGALASAYIGLFSSLLGIGGGIIQVPFLVLVLRFPPHVATATSQLVLMVLSLVATIAHLAQGAFDGGLDHTMYLAVGVMMGAPFGAMLSSRVRGSVIVRLLALALCLVGCRLLLGRAMH